MESKSSKTWKRHEDDRPAREVNRYETCGRRSCVIWHYPEPDDVNKNSVTEHSLETMLFHALPGQPFLALSEGPPICNSPAYPVLVPNAPANIGLGMLWTLVRMAIDPVGAFFLAVLLEQRRSS